MPLYAPSVIIPIYAVFTAIGIILTLLRFYVRTSVSRNAHSRNPFGLDDLFISIGLLITLTCSAIQFYNATNSNQGKAYTSAMKAPQRIIGMRIEFAMTVIEKPAFGAIKLSLLFFYRRIFGHWPSFQKVNNALVVIIVIWVMGFVFADLFICGSHLEYYYALNQALGKAHCGSKGLALVLFAFTSVITDLFVVSLPLFYIRRLQLRRSKRIAACVVFLLGGVSTLAGILRVIFLCIAYPLGILQWGYTGRPEEQLPLAEKVIQPTFWVMMEMLLGLWAANLPVLAPLMRAISNRYHSSSIYRKLSRPGRTEGTKRRTEVRTVVHVRPLKSWHSRSDQGSIGEQDPRV